MQHIPAQIPSQITIFSKNIVGEKADIDNHMKEDGMVPEREKYYAVYHNDKYYRDVNHQTQM